MLFCSVTLGTCEFDHKFIVCTNLLCQVILCLDFAQNFRTGIDWNNQGHLCLHQNHKTLVYSIQVNHKENSVIYSADSNKTILISDSNVILPFQTIAMLPAKSTSLTGTMPDKSANEIANPFSVHRKLFFICAQKWY